MRSEGVLWAPVGGSRVATVLWGDGLPWSPMAAVLPGVSKEGFRIRGCSSECGTEEFFTDHRVDCGPPPQTQHMTLLSTVGLLHSLNTWAHCTQWVSSTANQHMPSLSTMRSSPAKQHMTSLHTVGLLHSHPKWICNPFAWIKVQMMSDFSYIFNDSALIELVYVTGNWVISKFNIQT